MDGTDGRAHPSGLQAEAQASWSERRAVGVVGGTTVRLNPHQFVNAVMDLDKLYDDLGEPDPEAVVNARHAVSLGHRYESWKRANPDD
jgi:hypothetical protein